VAAVTDGTNIALYVDGVLDRSVPMSQRLWTNGTPWTLGRGWYFGPGDNFNGYLDEVRLTERALAPSEFLNASGIPPSPQLLVNGSFEIPGLALNTGVALTNGDAGLTGWTVISDYVGRINGEIGELDFPAADGTHHLLFNSGNRPTGGAVSQSFNTVAGFSYALDFRVGRIGTGPGVMQLLATLRSAGSNVLASRTAIPPAHGYGAAEHLEFIATTAVTTLEFLDTSTATLGVDVLLDAVSVTQLAPPPYCTTPPGGLVAWWPAEGNASDIANGNTGILTNGTTFAPGKVGQAFNFDGVNDHVIVPNFITNLPSFTFEFWIKIDSFTHPDYMAAFCQSPPNYPPTGPTFCFFTGNKGNAFGMSGRWTDGSIFELRTAIPFGTGEWKHVVVTYDGVMMKQFVDGSLLNQVAYAGKALGGTHPLLFGKAYAYPGFLVATFLDGALDEFTAYDRALSASEIAALFAAGSSGKCTAPTIVTQPFSRTNEVGTTATCSVTASGIGSLSYQWRFNGTNLGDGGRVAGATSSQLTISGLQLADAGGYSVVVANAFGSVTSVVATLTMVLPPPCAAPPSGLVAWWPGQGNAMDLAGNSDGTATGGVAYASARVGQGFQFNGTNAAVLVPDTANLLYPGTNSFSVEAWIRTTDTNGFHPIVARYENGGSGTPGVRLSTYYLAVLNGRLNGFLRDADGPGTAGLDLSGGRLVADGEFHHVALVRDTTANALRLFVDGSLDATTPLTAEATGVIGDDDGLPDPFVIGAQFDFHTDSLAFLFNGQIDEASYYSRALTADEVVSLYLSGSSGKCVEPRILTGPTNQVIACGGSTSFDATAYSVQPLHYQWFFNGTNAIPGATNQTLAIPAVMAIDAGTYSVVVSNALGTATGTSATLTVLDPTPPTLVCPTNLLVTIPAVSNEVVVAYPAPVASDDCSPVTVLCLPPSGSPFVPGTNFVHCIATDASGNSNECAFAIVVNRAPLAVADTMIAVENASASVLFTALLANDTDADGHALSIIGLASASTNGGSVIATTTNITFTPVPGFTGLDRFDYTIADALGGMASASVAITVLPGTHPAIHRIADVMLGPDRVSLGFLGVPGTTYLLERSVDLIGWTVVSEAFAPADGRMVLEDPNPPSGTAFYRARTR
ncbi:MAG TPA: LamG-like jellyroll fold domain-containing protein, partial [Methylomirabilota bacterium]|nr:LamG-like jellyroll fold domain-containing protein [Methylomirabilota bacterium]